MQILVEAKTQSWLVWFLRGVLIVGFFFLFARLIDLQIIRGSYFRALAEENRIRKIPILAERGRILARGGEVLVDSVAVKKLVVFDLLGGFEKKDLKDSRSPEDEVITEAGRNYLLKDAFAHVSGYIGKTKSNEVNKIRGSCPEKGPRSSETWVGRGGLEEQYDCVLSGIDGEELIEVDALGRKVRTLGRRLPLPGKDLVTTIDYKLQEKVATLLSGMSGAILVTDTEGEVLALYSSPSFDPNLFVSGNKESVLSVLNDKSLPLFNRAVSGVFHPGSVFKPIVAIASLEEGVIDRNFLFNDTGQIVIDTLYGSFTYKNWYFAQYGGVEGNIGVIRAIARSTDTFFYKIGELLGPEKIAHWANIFGLDKKTGIDIPGEVEGLVPTPDWKINVKKEKWFLGNTYHMAIGQGDIALTPIGINSAITTIANGGRLCTPHIVEENFVSENSQYFSSNLQCKNLGIKKENIDLVKEGMRQACMSGGTGFPFFDFKEKTGIEVGCKTGTAENPFGKPHAWFSVFGPFDNPQIVVTVLVENGGEGSRVAAPIARKIFDYWFVEKRQ